MVLSDCFKGFEKGIAKLTEEQREAFFCECEKTVYKGGALQIYKNLYDRPRGNLTCFLPKPMNCQAQDTER